MGVRESLLNTITSVADSDFVRIVTSAGASSKATVKNLFKSFESNLSAKSSLTTSDYIRVVGSDDVAYKQTISSLSDLINTSLPIRQLTASSFANLDTQVGEISGVCRYFASVTGTDGPTASKNTWTVIGYKNTGNVYAFQYAFTFDDVPYVRTKQNSSTWSAWQKLPTRAEVDALKNKFKSITTGDLNDYHESGLYVVYTSADNVANCPLGWSALVVIGVSATGAAHQICYNNNAMWVRSYTGSPLEWKAWVKMPTRAEVDALNSKTDLTLNYTSNSYVTEATLKNGEAKKVGNLLLFKFNSSISNFPTGSSVDNTQIGTISGWNASTATNITISPQNGVESNGILLLTISNAGVITISNRSGLPCNGFYRGVVVASIN